MPPTVVMYSEPMIDHEGAVPNLCATNNTLIHSPIIEMLNLQTHVTAASAALVATWLSTNQPKLRIPVDKIESDNPDAQKRSLPRSAIRSQKSAAQATARADPTGKADDATAISGPL